MSYQEEHELESPSYRTGTTWLMVGLGPQVAGTAWLGCQQEEETACPGYHQVEETECHQRQKRREWKMLRDDTHYPTHIPLHRRLQLHRGGDWLLTKLEAAQVSESHI